MKSKDFRIVFFGTSDFAQAILHDLCEEGYDVIAVVTRPDKPTGRNLKLSPSQVKSYIEKNRSHISIYTPEKASTVEFEQILNSLKPDLFVIAAYGEIIKPNILNLPRCGSINIHPSLLPKYRGPSPLQAALLNGDTKTGVCIIDVAQKMDAGVIYAQKEFEIDLNENFTMIQGKALLYTKDLLISVIQDKQKGIAKGLVQDESLVTFCKKITVEHEKIDWEEPLLSIHNKIRALSEKPGAWCYIQLGQESKRVKIYSSRYILLSQDEEAPNPKKSIYVKKGQEIIQIMNLQIEGKKRLSAIEFLSGLRDAYKFF
jgi:methionyl-tRNA formyltransferase